ncbi:uncharacterized protein LOC121379180 [Gigantopelta aegis]|uniref:uncharacterized protein LOC121379180 n=1 Tax=Gigantopelta aegis TaxID=1735272 RepID=UPI001B8874C1|nr:uncharacterized protein LOC121379180 [Gigantopelta aegis]
MKPNTWKEKRQHMVKSHISLEAVYSYVKHYEYPPGTSDLDKRSIRKRAKSFTFLDNHFVYIPEKSQKTLDDGTEINIEPRRVLLKDEKRRQAVWEAHVDEHGTHLGMEKTTSAVSKTYYWMGISSLVREIIRDCAVCRASKAACGTTVSMPILTSEIKLEVECAPSNEDFEPFVPFHSMRIETATSFWQKVELQILGPFSQGKSKMFAVLCLDRYSLWTEGAVIPTISSATVTHVVLNLICRFGSMQSLLLRENDTANRNTVEIREDLFEKAGLDVKLTVDNSAETANMWKSIEHQVKTFTEQHPTCWSQCLDLCLLPLRISRPDMVEYTPDFLIYNREIALPPSLSHRPENFDMELHLNPEQMTETTEVLMNIYNGFCLSFPYYIPKLTLARQIPNTAGAVPKTNIVTPCTPATTTTTTTAAGCGVTPDVSSTNTVSVEASTTVMETATVAAATTHTEATTVTTATTITATTTSTGEATATAASAQVKSTTVPTSDQTETVGRNRGKDKSVAVGQISPRKVVTRSGRVSIPTPGMVSLLTNSRLLSGKDTRNKSTAKCVNVDGDGAVDDDADSAAVDDDDDDVPDEDYVPLSKKTRSGRLPKEKKAQLTSGSKKSAVGRPRVSSSKIEKEKMVAQETGSFDFLDKMEDLDTYYAALKQYIKLGTYQSGTTIHQKRVIRKISKNYVVDDDVMYYVQESKGKATKKMVVMTMSERIDLLRSAHVLDDGSHVCKQKIVETLDQQTKYWKGLTLDAYAFTRACQTCDHGRERLRDYSYLKDEEEDEEEEDDGEHSSEEDGGQEESYDDLVNYMRHRRYPRNSTPNQKSTIRKRSKNFAFIDDELFYVFSKSSDAPPRKVILTEAERQAVIKEAHSAHHWGINKTMVNARDNGYWSGMTADCHNYLKKCKHCSHRLLTSSMQDEIKKKKMRIEERVKRFQEMFVAKILEMDSKARKSTPVISVKVERDSTDQGATGQGGTYHTEERTQSEHMAPGEQTPLPADQMAPSSDKTTSSIEQTTPSDNTVPDDVEHTYSVIQRSDSGTLTLSTSPAMTGDQTVADGDQLVTSATGKMKQTLVDSAADIIVETDDGQFVIENDYVRLLPTGTQGHGQSLKLEEGVEITVMYDNEHFIQAAGDPNDASEGTSSQQVHMFVNHTNAAQQTKVGVKPSKKQKFKCDYCGKIIKGTISFKYHIFKHTGVKPFECELCPKKFTNSKSCRLHMRKHTGETPFLCNLCGRGFSRAASLQYHLRAHSAGGGVPVQCNVCQREFTTAIRMRKHMECKHPETPPIFQCLQCNKFFTAARSLKRHQASHQGVRQYQCQICGRSFFRKEYLNSHMLQHPEAGSMVTSKSKSHRKKSQLTVSYETTSQGLHQGVEAEDGQQQQQQQQQHYQCHYCGQTFYRKDFLSSHMLQHPEAGSIVIIAANGQTKKAEMALSYDGHQFGHDTQELQRQQAEEAAQEQAIRSIVQIDATPTPESTAYVLSQDAVEYEVECLTSESLTEADLKAIQILTQASLHGTM